MSTVIKAGEQGGRLLRRLDTIDLADHLAEAHKIVGAAQREAAAILASARSAAVEIRQQTEQRGYDEGFRRGYEEGVLAGREEALRAASERFRTEQADLCRTFCGVVTQFEAQKRDVMIAAQQDLLRLAATVAEKVTKRAVALDPSAATANLEAVIRLVGVPSDLVVRIHPQDAETMRRFAQEPSGRLGAAVHMTVVEDESVSPGGCIVQTQKTEVDATIDTQVDQLVSLIVGRASQE